MTIKRLTPNPSPVGQDANEASKKGRGDGKIPAEISPDPESMKRGPKGRSAKRIR
jgi:hypothetical protein